jgi:hypothetical protein
MYYMVSLLENYKFVLFEYLKKFSQNKAHTLINSPLLVIFSCYASLVRMK